MRGVEQRAREDAQSETPPASVRDLNDLYGGRAKAEGLLLEQIVDAYRAAYTAARPPNSFWKEYLPHPGVR